MKVVYQHEFLNRQPIITEQGEIIHEIAVGEKQSVAHVLLPSRIASPAHMHIVLEEIYYILSGAAYLVIDGKTTPVEAGTTVVISAGETHKIVNPYEEPCEFIVTCCPPWTPEDYHIVQEKK